MLITLRLATQDTWWTFSEHLTTRTVTTELKLSHYHSALACSAHRILGQKIQVMDYPFIGHPTTYVIGNSRYLIPAQSLLNELVNVGFKNIDETPKLSSEFFRSKIVPSPDKHELHITLTKLIGLLEEVTTKPLTNLPWFSFHSNTILTSIIGSFTGRNPIREV